MQPIIQPDLYRAMTDDQAREHLFAACIHKGQHLSTMKVKVNSYQDRLENELVYRPPELIRQNIEVRVSFNMGRITYYFCPYYPYEYDHITVQQTQTKMNSAKTDRADLSKSVNTILNGLKKRRKDILLGQYDYTKQHHVKEYELVEYALGIMEQSNDIMHIEDDQLLTSTSMIARISFRKNANFVIRNYEGAKQMFIQIAADCTLNDMLQSVHHMIDLGYNMHHFEHTPPEKSSLSYYVIRMNIETEYNSDVFKDIQDTQVFQRQIANEIEAL